MCVRISHIEVSAFARSLPILYAGYAERENSPRPQVNAFPGCRVELISGWPEMPCGSARSIRELPG
eukprot:12071423-Alexandrium_andersonii.AAC.1